MTQTRHFRHEIALPGTRTRQTLSEFLGSDDHELARASDQLRRDLQSISDAEREAERVTAEVRLR